MSQGPAPDATSVELLAMARAGDEGARDRLFERYVGPLRRWARGRVPRWAAATCDTDDVVQDALLGTIRNLDGFDRRRSGAFQAYLRQAVRNRIRDLVRVHSGTRPLTDADGDLADPAADPLRLAIGRELHDRYERALSSLDPESQGMVIARIELGFSYKEIATDFAKPSEDAARMAVVRAIRRLAEEMRSDG